MSRKIPGSAIVPGTITVTQITGGLNDTTNASYAQANTARTTANDAYGQANTARTQANTAYGQANNAYSSANLAYEQANASYNVANTKLASVGGTLSGDLIITGNLTVSGNSTTLNTEVLTVEDAEVILLSNVAGTPALNAGIIVNRGTSTNTFLRWDEALDEWGWSDSGTTTYYFEDLRAGLATTNTTFGTVNTSLGTINTSYQAAYAQANTAGTNALNAYGQANAAYGAANNTVLKAGDTMTGQLNISSGGLLVTGNVGIGTTSPGAKLDVVAASFNGGPLIGARFNTANFRMGFGIANSNGFPFLGVNVNNAANDNGTFDISSWASRLRMDNGIFQFQTSSISGTAGNAITWSTHAYLDTSGNLGIGTTSPTSKLDLVGVMQWQATAGTVLGKLTYSGGEPVVLANTGLGLNFYTNNAFAAKIDSSGNLGLGVTPSAWGGSYKTFQTGGGSFANYNNTSLALVQNAYDTGAGAWKYYANGAASFLQQTSGEFYWYTAGSGTAGNAISFTTAMTLTAAGRLGIGVSSVFSKLHLKQGADGTSTEGLVIEASANDNRLAHYYDATNNQWVITATYGSTGAFKPFTWWTSDTKRMTLDTSGNLGIGTASPGSYKLYVQGDQYISGTLTEASSVTLKENINPILNALDLITNLTGVTYDRKDGSAINRAGLIAEEVEQVLPNIIQKDKEGNPSGIQYTNLIAYLVESIKELKTEIDSLKKNNGKS